MRRWRLGVAALLALGICARLCPAGAQSVVSPAQIILPPQVSGWESANEPTSYLTIQGNVATLPNGKYTLEYAGTYPGTIQGESGDGETFKVINIEPKPTNARATTYLVLVKGMDSLLNKPTLWVESFSGPGVPQGHDVFEDPGGVSSNANEKSWSLDEGGNEFEAP